MENTEQEWMCLGRRWGEGPRRPVREGRAGLYQVGGEQEGKKVKDPGVKGHEGDGRT